MKIIHNLHHHDHHIIWKSPQNCKHNFTYWIFLCGYCLLQKSCWLQHVRYKDTCINVAVCCCLTNYTKPHHDTTTTTWSWCKSWPEYELFQHNILSSALQYKVTWYQQPTGTNMALCMYIYANPLHDNPTGTQWLVMLSGGLKQPLPCLHNDNLIFILPYLSDSNIPVTMSHQHYTTWPPWLTMWHHDADRFLRLFDVVGGQTTVRVATHELLPLVVPGHWAQSLQHTQKKDTLQQRKIHYNTQRKKYTLQDTEKKYMLSVPILKREPTTLYREKVHF